MKKMAIFLFLFAMAGIPLKFNCKVGILNL
jgi:hypothetical protein